MGVKLDVVFWAKAAVMFVLYLAVGPLLIMLNKHILDASGLNWQYPITLSSLGQTFITIVTWAGVQSGYLSITPQATNWIFNEGGWKGCLAVGVCKALTLSFGNAVYLHLPMGYIQMLKAFSPCTVLTLLVLSGVEKLPSKPILMSVLAIALSTAATTAVEASATPTGLFYMAMAQGTEGGALVITQMLLKKKKFTIVESQYFLAPPSCLFLCILCLATGETGRILSRGDIGTVFNNKIQFFLAASLGLVVNYLTFAVIQFTSSTMLKVMATVRNVLAIIGGAWVFHEHIPPHEWLCYAFTLIGFGMYTHFSMNKPKETPAKEKPMQKQAPAQEEPKETPAPEQEQKTAT